MAVEELITMSQQEVLRLQVIEKLKSGVFGQSEASKILKISCRQIRRLLKTYKRQGAKSLISKKRGKPSNNRIGEETRQNVLALIKEKYIDFGPTFLGEKLLEKHNIAISKETLRQLMISENIWKTKRRKKARIHQMRERRSCFGELIQIDGSPHDWFEGRGEKCCLLVFIDDATSKLVNLRFEEAETTAGYFRAAKEYVIRHGLPMAFYSDKHNIFRVNMPGCEEITQFGRAAEELGIEIICANSAQAKGRVERANQTLQDRLIKEMRLRGISDIKAANAYVPEFIECHDKKFAVEPKSSVDAHVKLNGDEDLDLIFCFKEDRKLSKNLELSYYNTIYQIKIENSGYRLRHAKVKVCEDLEGKITIIYKGEKLEYSCYKKQKRAAEIIEAKALNNKVDSIAKKRRKPSANHVWRRPWKQSKIIYTSVPVDCNNVVFGIV
jgi:transposase